MTRLVENWIKDIRTSIKEYEKELMAKTGMNLMAIASAASGVDQGKIMFELENNKIGIVPITTGLGIIDSFTESVASVLLCMGFEAFVTKQTDVSGLLEAHEKGASIQFMADDDQFIAVHLKKNLIAENNWATARGFVAALEGATGSLRGKEVLVIGCGNVGTEALSFLKEKGASPIAYDKNEVIMKHLTQKGYETLSHINRIGNYSLIVDASNEGGWIKKGMLDSKAWIVTPGVPISLDEEACAFHKNRLIHDYLPIGVATMMASVCK